MTTPNARIEINYNDLQKYARGGAAHEAMCINDALRKAGVPVVGFIGLLAVERGRLVVHPEKRNGVQFFVYEWTDDVPSDGDWDDEDEL